MKSLASAVLPGRTGTTRQIWSMAGSFGRMRRALVMEGAASLRYDDMYSIHEYGTEGGRCQGSGVARSAEAGRAGSVAAGRRCRQPVWETACGHSQPPDGLYQEA